MYHKTVLPAALTVALTLATVLTVASQALAQEYIAVEGVIHEVDRDLPVGYATIQVEGTGRVTMSNADGRYRILIDRSHTRLKFSHIAYRTLYASVEPSDTLVILNTFLALRALQGDTLVVTTRSAEPGRRIIREAIRRKQDILDRITTYSLDAYVKTVIEDLDNPDTTHIFALTETQLTQYYEKPDQYKDVIHYRRQSSNINAAENLVYIGEVINFNKNRIDVGRYSIVSPTATDALDHYEFYLIDTVEIDERPAFLLELEPKNPDLPRFFGHIHIADSTYDVLDVDVGFSRGIEISLVSNLRYGQTYAQFQDEYWLPVEERVTGDVDFNVKIPGLPSHLQFTYLAAMQNYTIDDGHPPGVMDGVLLEVDESADDFDTATWYAGMTVPLSAYEEAGLARIDSLEELPPSFGQIAAMGAFGATAALAGAASEFFRFNRVEDVYLGAAVPIEIGKRFDGEVSLGYAFGPKRVWQKYSAEYRASEQWQLDVGLEYELHSRKRPSISTRQSYDPSGLALLGQLDPWNYYQAQAFRAWTEFAPSRQWRLYLDYRDQAHSSLALSTDWSLFNQSRPVRDNPAIDEGNERSFGGRLIFDSRPFMLNKGRYRRLGQTQYTRVVVGGELSKPAFVDSDFDYTRFYVQLRRRMRTLGLGVTTLEFMGGGSDGDMPSQRWFGVDDGNGVFFQRGGFFTLDQQTYGGLRFFSTTLHHNFRTLLWVQSGIPGLKKLPWWLTIHGGILWADWQNLAPIAGDPLVLTANKPYSELGFGLANLTPFINPLNFAVYFTWQLSSYDTRGFALRLGVEL